jgi:hypothetical protein
VQVHGEPDRAFSTFRILPRSGRVGWNCGRRAPRSDDSAPALSEFTADPPGDRAACRGPGYGGGSGVNSSSAAAAGAPPPSST